MGSREPFISPDLGSSDTIQKSGYTIQMAATPYGGAPPACNGLGAGLAGQGFSAAADPSQPNNPRFFATNANNIIYEHTATLFAVMPETGPPPVGQMIIR